MEAINEGLATETAGWDAWDAVPRDGPAVFVVDAEAFDRGEVIGKWINPFIDHHEIDEQLRQLLGVEPKQGRWAIVDQVGLSRMVNETPTTLTPEAWFSEPGEDEQ